VGAYKDLLRLPGAAMFSAAGLLARSGGAMMGIGIVLMVSAQYDSYGLAGGVSAANTIAWAGGAALLSNLVDRYGQRRVMLPSAIVSAAALAVLVVLGTMRAPAWTLFIPAALSGLFGGAPGALVRARWNHLLKDAHQLHTAFSLESTLDELTFVVGPVLATFLATEVAPSAGLVAPIVLSTAGAFWFYSLRATEPPPTKPRTRSKQTAHEDGVLADRHTGWLLAHPGVAAIALVTVMVGGLFGAIDVSVVAATEAWDVKSMAGVVLGAMSIGSAIGGLGYGSRNWVSSVTKRWLVGIMLLAVTMALPLAASGPWLLGVAGFLAGFSVAPSLINLNTLVQRLAPSGRLTEGLAWVSASLGVGVSIGSTVAGQLIDQINFRAGFVCAFGAALAAALLALAVYRYIGRLIRREQLGVS
jgi:MFS family permease